jgi:Proline racemase
MAGRMIGVQWDLKESNAVRTTRRQSWPGDEGKIDRARADGGGRRLPGLLRNWLGFVSRIARQAGIGGRKGIVPIISSRAWITGVNQYMLHLANPWPSG